MRATAPGSSRWPTIRSAVPIDADTAELAGAGLLATEESATFSDGKVRAVRRTRLGGIELTSTPITACPELAREAIARLRGLGLRPIMLTALAAILDKAPSGDEVAVGEGQGTVRLVSAFELGSGQLCREYELARPGAPGLVSVACRKASTWETRLAVARPEGGDGYAPASSLETVDAFLTSIGAGQPLDADAEKKALAGTK